MRATRVLVALGLALGATGWAAPADAAPSFAPPGSVGHDVSYPQCGQPLPVGAFGVVGVNGGRNFSANTCLATEYGWATSLPNQAMVYLNTGNPGNQSSFWPATPTSEEGAVCANPASPSDPGCAYIYGQRAAAYAMETAAAAGVSLDTTWWLDVETANSWDGDGPGNTAELQGMFDHLRDNGVASVGLYSTGLQWGEITGGFSTTTAASYQSAWSAYFTPTHAMAPAPNWIAGVTASAAAGHCGTSFSGGPPMLAQFVTDGFDHNLVCGAATRTPANYKACLPGAGIPAGYTPIYGTRGNDVLIGTNAKEIFYASAGNDTVKAGGGDDILCGGTGGDTLNGQDGNDIVVGDAGNDKLYGGAGNDKLYGDKDNGRLYGNSGSDHLYGGAGKDRLYGNTGNDALDGGTNRDSCSGGGGKNTARSC